MSREILTDDELGFVETAIGTTINQIGELQDAAFGDPSGAGCLGDEDADEEAILKAVASVLSDIETVTRMLNKFIASILEKGPVKK